MGRYSFTEECIFFSLSFFLFNSLFSSFLFFCFLFSYLLFSSPLSLSSQTHTLSLSFHFSFISLIRPKSLQFHLDIRLDSTHSCMDVAEVKFRCVRHTVEHLIKRILIVRWLNRIAKRGPILFKENLKQKIGENMSFHLSLIMAFFTFPSLPSARTRVKGSGRGMRG